MCVGQLWQVRELNWPDVLTEDQALQVTKCKSHLEQLGPSHPASASCSTQSTMPNKQTFNIQTAALQSPAGFSNSCWLQLEPALLTPPMQDIPSHILEPTPTTAQPHSSCSPTPTDWAASITYSLIKINFFLQWKINWSSLFAPSESIK